MAKPSAEIVRSVIALDSGSPSFHGLLSESVPVSSYPDAKADEENPIT